MQFRSKGQILVDVLEAREWWEKIGISTTGTRLEQIHRYLDELLNPVTPDESNRLGGDTTKEDTYYALSDGAGFGLIAAEMRKLSPQSLPRRTLRDILGGSLAASKEGSASDPGNKFVELELAAHFSSAGFMLLGFDDLRFEFEGCRYLVECKRPSRGGTLDENIEKAYKQLRNKLVDPLDRGIVAVAVEKVFDLDSRFHEFESASSASQFAVSIARRLRDKIQKSYRTWLDPRVVGVAAVIRFLMRTTKPSLIGSSYVLVLLKFASPQVGQAAESARLDRMVETLRTKFLAT